MSYLLHHTPHTQLDDSGLWQMAVSPWTVSFQILLASGPSITITRGGPWIKEWVQRPPWLCVPEQHCNTAHEVGVSCEKLFNSRTKRQFIGMRTRTLSTRTIPTWTLRPRELVPTLKRKEKVLRESYRSGFERRDAFVPTLESGTHLTFLLLASTAVLGPAFILELLTQHATRVSVIAQFGRGPHYRALTLIFRHLQARTNKKRKSMRQVFFDLRPIIGHPVWLQEPLIT